MSSRTFSLVAGPKGLKLAPEENTDWCLECETVTEWESARREPDVCTRCGRVWGEFERTREEHAAAVQERAAQ